MEQALTFSHFTALMLRVLTLDLQRREQLVSTGRLDRRRVQLSFGLVQLLRRPGLAAEILKALDDDIALRDLELIDLTVGLVLLTAHVLERLHVELHTSAVLAVQLLLTNFGLRNLLLQLLRNVSAVVCCTCAAIILPQRVQIVLATAYDVLV